MSGARASACFGFLVSLGKAVFEIKCASPQVMIVGGFRLRDEVQDLRRSAGRKIRQSKLVTNLDIFRTEEVGRTEVSRGIAGLSIPEEKLAEGGVPLEIRAEMFGGRLRLGPRVGGPARFEFGPDNIEGHIGAARIQPSGPDQVRQRGGGLLQFKKHNSEIVGGVGLMGIQFHGLLQLDASVLEAVVPQICQSEVVVT